MRQSGRADPHSTSSTKSGPRGGRPSKRGKLLPKPEAIAADDSRAWQTCDAFIYGCKQTIRYETPRYFGGDLLGPGGEITSTSTESCSLCRPDTRSLG